MAPAFEKANGIKVEFTLLPIDALVARLKAELSSGEGGIDIVQWDASMAGWVSRHMQDHAQLLQGAASKHPDFDWADFLPAVQNMATYEGKLSGIPYRVTTGILFYQKQLLEQAGVKPPTNFAELLAAAEATTKQGAPNRFGFGCMGRQGPAMLGSFTPFLRSSGGQYYDPKTGDIFVNQPAAVGALQYYGDLMTKYHVTNPASLTWEFDGIIAGGQADQFAMTVTLAPYGEAMNNPAVSKTGGNWAFSVMPGKDDMKQNATYLAGWMLGVPEKAKNTDWSFEFIQMATSKQWMMRSIDLGNAPPRASVLQAPDGTGKASLGTGRGRGIQDRRPRPSRSAVGVGAVDAAHRHFPGAARSEDRAGSAGRCRQAVAAQLQAGRHEGIAAKKISPRLHPIDPLPTIGDSGR